MGCAVPGSAPAPRVPASLEHLGLIAFVPVMGLSGLSLAWVQAAARMGEVAARVAQAAAVLAAALMLAMLGITLWRFVRWPVVLLMLVQRLQRLGPWPDRLRASVFILNAPPAVMGLGLSLWKVPLVWPLVLWGVALVFVALALRQLPQCFDQPFGWPMWSLSFPLTAFAALTLRLANAGVLPHLLALLVLALASVVIAALLRWTWWGLRSGDLLQPEPAPVPRP